MIPAIELRRYLVYRSRATRARGGYLCVCAARNAKEAVRIARQSFVLPRDAYALPES